MRVEETSRQSLAARPDLALADPAVEYPAGRVERGVGQVKCMWSLSMYRRICQAKEATLSTAISPLVTTITLRPGSLDHHVTTYAPTPPANMPLPRNDSELEADIDTTTTSASSDHQSLAHGIAPSVRGGGAESGIHAGCAVEERGVAAGSQRGRGYEVCREVEE